MVWRKFNGETLTIPIEAHLRKCIEEESAKHNKLKVYIGTDSQVKQAVTNGIGIMPAFGNDKILTPQEIEAVSFYVEKVAGN